MLQFSPSFPDPSLHAPQKNRVNTKTEVALSSSITHANHGTKASKVWKSDSNNLRIETDARQLWLDILRGKFVPTAAASMQRQASPTLGGHCPSLLLAVIGLRGKNLHLILKNQQGVIGSSSSFCSNKSASMDDILPQDENATKLLFNRPL